MLGLALNEIFVPPLQRALPEIVDFYLSSEACGYRMVVTSIRKAYAVHARRVMMGLWSHLRQFLYWWSTTTWMCAPGPTRSGPSPPAWTRRATRC